MRQDQRINAFIIISSTFEGKLKHQTEIFLDRRGDHAIHVIFAEVPSPKLMISVIIYKTYGLTKHGFR